LACGAGANAETFAFTGAAQTFTVSVSGEYAVELLGASGGNSTFFGFPGGLGAEVSGDIFLTAGEDLTLFVGGRGGSSANAGGGGGGGGPMDAGGGPGLAGTSGGTAGVSGGAGGVGGTGGGAISYLGGGGGGAGVKTSSAGYGGEGGLPGVVAGFGGKFPNGGGGGGASGSNGGGGGGGSGFSGGGGGGVGGNGGGGGGGGGGSYLASLFTDPVLTAGVNGGDGSISITSLTPAVPEPSTWAMTLAGFAGLGWLAHTRRRKTSPA
jgi:hypothetical protein